MDDILFATVTDSVDSLKKSHNIHFDVTEDNGALKRAKVCGDGCLFSVTDFKPGKGTYIHAKNAYARHLINNKPAKSKGKITLKVSATMFERLVEFLASDRIDIDQTIYTDKLVAVKS